MCTIHGFSERTFFVTHLCTFDTTPNFRGYDATTTWTVVMAPGFRLRGLLLRCTNFLRLRSVLLQRYHPVLVDRVVLRQRLRKPRMV